MSPKPDIPAPDEHRAGLARSRTTIDVDRFRAGLARLATDATLRERLEKEPLEVLPELGILLDENKRAEAKGKTLTELMNQPTARAVPSPTAHIWADTFAHVAIVMPLVISW